MSQASHIYADRIINVAVTGNLVRLELGVMQAPAAEGQKAQFVAAQTIVVPLDGFIPSFGMMEAVLKKLVAEGVLQLQQPQNSAPPEAPAAKAKK